MQSSFLRQSACASVVLCAAIASSLPSAAAAGLFSGGIPAGWMTVGNAGTSGADGDVGLSPTGFTQYGWVSTARGVADAGVLPGIGNNGGSPSAGDPPNGSTLTSTLFSATAGQTLRFFFNYVTTDGAGFADYAWARLLDGALNQVAVLFTARTTPAGNSVPGFGLPGIAATITPAVVAIPDVIDSNGDRIGPAWGPLAEPAGACFAEGCGLTGWVQSDYVFASSGNFFLQFGVTNWDDSAYQSGLAFDGITIDGKPIEDIVIPLPAPLLLLASGLATLFAFRRRASA